MWTTTACVNLSRAVYQGFLDVQCVSGQGSLYDKKQELLAFRSNSYSLQLFYHIQKYFTFLRKQCCHVKKAAVLYLDIMNLGGSVLI